MYTHTFEIQLNGNMIQGELSIDGDIDIKYDELPRLRLGQFERINMLFRAICQLCLLGEEKITKIEIVKK